MKGWSIETWAGRTGEEAVEGRMWKSLGDDKLAFVYCEKNAAHLHSESKKGLHIAGAAFTAFGRYGDANVMIGQHDERRCQWGECHWTSLISSSPRDRQHPRLGPFPNIQTRASRDRQQAITAVTAIPFSGSTAIAGTNEPSCQALPAVPMKRPSRHGRAEKLKWLGSTGGISRPLDKPSAFVLGHRRRRGHEQYELLLWTPRPLIRTSRPISKWISE
jgi:hypothetical protein